MLTASRVSLRLANVSDDGPAHRCPVRAVEQTFVTSVSLLGLNLLTGVVAARLLGPQGRGELAAIQLWPSILAPLALLGLPEASLYHVLRKRRALPDVLATGSALCVASALFGSLLALFLLPWLLQSQTTDTLVAGRIMLLLLILHGLSAVSYQLFRAAARYDIWNSLRLLAPAGWLIVLVCLGVTSHGHPIPLALGYIGVVVVTSSLNIWLNLRFVTPLGRFCRPLIRPLLKFGLPSVLSSYPQLVSSRLDQLVMVALLPPADVGFYVVAVAWTAPIGVLPSAVGSVAFPSAAESTEEDAGPRVCRYLRLTVLVSFAASAMLAVATPLLLPLVLGPSYLPAVPSAVVLTLAAVPLGISTVAAEIVRGLGRPGAILRAEAFGAGTTVALLAILIPSLGFTGAAVASAVAYTVTAIVILQRVRRLTKVPWRMLVVPTRSDIQDFIAEVRLIARRAKMRSDALDG